MSLSFKTLCIKSLSSSSPAGRSVSAAEFCLQTQCGWKMPNWKDLRSATLRWEEVWEVCPPFFLLHGASNILKKHCSILLKSTIDAVKVVLGTHFKGLFSVCVVNRRGTSSTGYLEVSWWGKPTSWAGPTPAPSGESLEEKMLLLEKERMSVWL